MKTRIVNLAVMIASILVVFPTETQSQIDFWQQTTAPKGDCATSVAFDSSNNVFVATIYGGIFRSTDSGDHWAQVNSGLPDYDVLSVAVLPDGTVLAGVSSGIFRSTDQGMSWHASSSGATFAGVGSIAIDPGGDVFAGDVSTGIYRSTDGGNEWVLSTTSHPDLRIHKILIAQNGDILAGTGTSGLLRSTDKGTSWETVTMVSPVISLVEDSAGHILAGTDGDGLYSSTNNGITWTKSDFPFVYVKALAVTPHGRVIAGTNDGMYLSSDRGTSWSQIGFASIPFTALQSGPSGDIIAGSWGYGVFRSTDDGDTWSQPFEGLTSIAVNALYLNKAHSIFAATSRAVYRSTDNGTNWVQCYRGLTTTNILSLAEGDSGWMFAGSSDRGLFRSKDNGNNWTQFGPTNFGARSLVVNHEGKLAAAGGTVFLLAQDGNTWTESTLPFTMPLAAALAVDLTGRMYLGADSGGVYLSTDNGGSWIPSGLNPPYPVPSVTVTANQHVLAGTYLGQILRSTNGGGIWEDASVGLSAWRITFLACYPNGFVFAGTIGPSGNGVFLSRDNGDHWAALGASLLDASVQALTVGENNFVFVGTGEQGIYKSIQPLTSISGTPGLLPASFSLEQNYPNPFNPSTTIRFSLPVRARVTLTVYNTLGQLVSTLVRGELDEGAHEVTFDGSGLASGVYFYRLQSGSFVQTRTLLLLR